MKQVHDIRHDSGMAALAVTKPETTNLIKFFFMMLTAFCVTASAPGARAQQAETCNPTAAQAALNSPSSDPDRNYRVIKNLEGCFAVPAPSLTAVVGTFDPITGKFTFSPQITDRSVRTIAPPVHDRSLGPVLKPIKSLDSVSTLSANAVNVALSFQSANGTPLHVSVSAAPGAIPGPANATGSPATINVGKASAVTFTIRAGNKTYEDSLSIVRPPVIGIGAFTIPVLPVTIVYAVPQGTNSFSSSTTLSTTLKTTLSTDSSTTQPVDADFISPATMFTTVTGLLKSFLPGPAGTPVDLMTKLVTGLNGSTSQSAGQGTNVTQNHSVTISDTVGNQDKTGVGGPGVGDVFVFLSNVRVMWVSQNGHVQLTLLGYDVTRKSADYLIKHQNTVVPFECLQSSQPNYSHCLTADGMKALLALDPLATSPLPQSLDAPRFVRFNTEDFSDTISSGSDTLSESHTVTTQDETVHANFNATVTDLKAASLSFIFPNLPDNKTQTTSVKTTSTISSGVSVGTTFSSSVTVNPTPGVPLAMDPYYDTLFGTFAFLPVPVTASPAIAGIAADAAGKVLANQTAVLQIGTKTYVTHTDAKGQYAFHAASIPAGAGVLTVGNVRKPVQVGQRLAQRTILVPPPPKSRP